MVMPVLAPLDMAAAPLIAPAMPPMEPNIFFP